MKCFKLEQYEIKKIEENELIKKIMFSLSNHRPKGRRDWLKKKANIIKTYKINKL